MGVHIDWFRHDAQACGHRWFASTSSSRSSIATIRSLLTAKSRTQCGHLKGTMT